MSIDPRELAAAQWTDAAERAQPPASLAYKPFPVADLPEPVAAFVAEGARAKRCDPALIALPLLAGLASAVGNARCVQLRSDWCEPALLWTVIVARSGSMKSPAFDLALQAVHRQQAEAMRRHARALETYRADLAAHRRSKSADDPPAEPRPERCIVDDCTIESVAALLAHNPRGLLVGREEMAAWFGSFNEYKGGRGGDAPKWLSMHGARPLIVDRKGGATIYIPRAALSLTGTIQPGPLRRALTTEHRESGLLARLLLAAPPEYPKRWERAGIDAEAERRIARLFDALYAMEPSIDADGAECPVNVRLSPEAERVWAAFYIAHDQERAGLPDDLAALWAKLEGGAARLALVVHMVRAAGGEPGIDPGAIDAASMVVGIGLSEWFGQEARRVYALFAESEEEGERRRLLEWIDRQGGSVSVSDVAHGLWAYRSKSAKAAADLDRLEKAGHGRRVYPPAGEQGGRPSARFQRITITETPAGWGGKGGCGDGDAPRAAGT